MLNEEGQIDNLEETALFIVHAIKQFCFGFELMDNLADNYADGSAGKAFFLNSIYQYLAIFYLIDRGSKPMGGAFYPALEKHNLQNLLDPARNVLKSKLGNTTFGEVIRMFRNTAIVHTGYSDSDTDRIYKKVDMSELKFQQEWQRLLLKIYKETRLLAIRLAKASGRKLSDF